MLHVDSKSLANGQVPQPPFATAGDEAIAHAYGVDDDGVHHFTAIKRDVGPVDFLNFRLPRDEAIAREWVNRLDGNLNLHYTTNEVREGCSSVKPSESDIVAIRVAHVDIDLKGSNTDDELAALWSEIQARQPENLQPSTAICSGGGFQMTFALEKKLPVAEAGDAIRALNNGLIKRLGGDGGTFNLDRLLRLAGPVNLPDQRKREVKGRSQRKATLISRSDAAYSLASLAAIVPPEPVAETADADQRVNEIIEELAGRSYEAVCRIQDLEPELADKLQAAMETSHKLRRAYAGDLSETAAANDEGKRCTVAMLLAHHGVFTSEEFATLLWLWGVMVEGFDYAERKLRPRDIARLYARRAEPVMQQRREKIAQATSWWTPPEEDGSTPGQPQAEPQDPFGYGSTERLLDLPTDTFPKVIDAWARDTGERMGVPAVYSAVCALATLAAAIGSKLWIQPKANDTSWKEPAILWVMLAEGVGGMKTPSMDAATKPLREIDHQSAKEGARRYAEWELLKKTAKGKDAILALPPEPKIKRNVVVDITVEALGAVLTDNRSGVLIHQDELAALLGSMDAYKSSKGGDRAKMLKLFNGGSESVDRVGRKHIPIDFWGASIVGGIQPRKLREISDNLDADGLLQRFLPIYGDGSAQSKEEVDREPDALAERAYFSLVRKWARAADFSNVKAVVTLSPQAQEVWKPVRGRIRDLSFLPGQSEAWKGHTAKWPGLSSRLLLLCHVLEHHEAETHQVDTIPVSAATARRAARLVDYLLANSLRFYSECVGAGETVYDARAVAGYILTKPDMTKITRRDIGDANKPLRTEYDRIKRAMQLLAYMGWVVPNTETRVDQRYGPTQWTICPEIHDGRFASYAELERKQRKVAQAQIIAASKERARIMGESNVFD